MFICGCVKLAISSLYHCQFSFQSSQVLHPPTYTFSSSSLSTYHATHCPLLCSVASFSSLLLPIYCFLIQGCHNIYIFFILQSVFSLSNHVLSSSYISSSSLSTTRHTTVDSLPSFLFLFLFVLSVIYFFPPSMPFPLCQIMVFLLHLPLFILLVLPLPIAFFISVILYCCLFSMCNDVFLSSPFSFKRYMTVFCLPCVLHFISPSLRTFLYPSLSSSSLLPFLLHTEPVSRLLHRHNSLPLPSFIPYRCLFFFHLSLSSPPSPPPCLSLVSLIDTVLPFVSHRCLLFSSISLSLLTSLSSVYVLCLPHSYLPLTCDIFLVSGSCLPGPARVSQGTGPRGQYASRCWCCCVFWSGLRFSRRPARVPDRRPASVSINLPFLRSCPCAWRVLAMFLLMGGWAEVLALVVDVCRVV